MYMLGIARNAKQGMVKYGSKNVVGRKMKVSRIILRVAGGSFSYFYFWLSCGYFGVGRMIVSKPAKYHHLAFAKGYMGLWAASSDLIRESCHKTWATNA